MPSNKETKPRSLKATSTKEKAVIREKKATEKQTKKNG